MDRYCFSFRGAYLGRLADDGVFYDDQGNERARVMEHDGLYDVDGRYFGRIDAQGSLFTADGTCIGYVADWSSVVATPD